jgi:hypothetical protein
MALNPPLNEYGEPCRVSGEHFILKRKGIQFEIKVDGLGKMKGEGIVMSYWLLLMLFYSWYSHLLEWSL